MEVTHSHCAGLDGLIQAAHAAVRCKDTYLKAVYQRLVKRRGKHKAIVAVAHRMREGGLPHLVETAGLPRLGSELSRLSSSGETPQPLAPSN